MGLPGPPGEKGSTVRSNEEFQLDIGHYLKMLK